MWDHSIILFSIDWIHKNLLHIISYYNHSYKSYTRAASDKLFGIFQYYNKMNI